jgi:hypothetical protein
VNINVALGLERDWPSVSYTKGHYKKKAGYTEMYMNREQIQEFLEKLIKSKQWMGCDDARVRHTFDDLAEDVADYEECYDGVSKVFKVKNEYYFMLVTSTGVVFYKDTVLPFKPSSMKYVCSLTDKECRRRGNVSEYMAVLVG